MTIIQYNGTSYHGILKQYNFRRIEGDRLMLNENKVNWFLEVNNHGGIYCHIILG